MKQSEKLDIILKELYKYRFDGKYYEIGGLLEGAKIEFEPHTELRMLGKRLENDGLIKAIWGRVGASACLTTHGIDYCEMTSYSYKNSAIVNNNYNISIQNSQNANIITSSENVNITYHQNQITEQVSKILTAIKDESSISKEAKNELIECIDELQTVVQNGGKPKITYRNLLENTSNFAGIGSLVIELGTLIFGK